MATKKETYPEARLRLFAGLSAAGHTVKPALKVPQCKLSTGETVYFKAQAVYLESHSLWIDIRGMSLEQFIGSILQSRQVRKLAGDASVCGQASHVLVRKAQ